MGMGRNRIVRAVAAILGVTPCGGSLIDYFYVVGLLVRLVLPRVMKAVRREALAAQRRKSTCMLNNFININDLTIYGIRSRRAKKGCMSNLYAKYF